MLVHLLSTVICRRKSWRLAITKPPSGPKPDIEAKDSRCEPGTLHRCSRTLANRALRSCRSKNHVFFIYPGVQERGPIESGKRLSYQTIRGSTQNPSGWICLLFCFFPLLFFFIFHGMCCHLYLLSKQTIVSIRRQGGQSVNGEFADFRNTVGTDPYHIWRQE